MIYDIRNNKSLQDIKDFNIKLSNCNPELIISNIEYIIYNIIRCIQRQELYFTKVKLG